MLTPSARLQQSPHYTTEIPDNLQTGQVKKFFAKDGHQSL